MNSERLIQDLIKITVGSTIMLGLLFLSSCTTDNKLLGHWKCDSTGTITSTYKGKTQTGPITELYNSYKTQPTEIEFLDDGIMINHQRKKDGSYKTEQSYYYQNYLGDPNKILIKTKDKDDDNILTIKSITEHEMRLSWESVEDQMVLDLVMKKIE